jgi:signal transduction histidine kinase
MTRSGTLFFVFFLVASLSSLLLMLSNVFFGQELQTINSRYEARPWLAWSPEGLSRLNPVLLWQYHQSHEIPCDFFHWDYTLSWLIEKNHPPVVNRFVLFNHQLEDEPPEEAIEQHKWMEPLRQVPVSRATVAKAIDFLRSAGARMIIVDRDFPQYSPDDRVLAESIYKAVHANPPVPVFISRTISRLNSTNILASEVPTKPSGVLAELSKLEPGVDVTQKYTGTVDLLPDQDQVARRIALWHPETIRLERSIVLKALSCFKEPIIDPIPTQIDIDFSAPPESELYPVRPFFYLLDPSIRNMLMRPPPGSRDVSVKGAIVVLGDSVTDVVETPLTNHDLNSRSGAETLVHAMETYSRGVWPQRSPVWELNGVDVPVYDFGYALLISSLGAIVWISWKSAPKPSLYGPLSGTKTKTLVLLLDLAALILLLATNYLVACCFFSYSYLIVPVFVPSIALSLGAIATTLWEREKEKEERYLANLKAIEDRMALANERHAADMAREKAEAKAREVLNDQLRRKEFVRRLNHDLNAPVGVLNWTLLELSEAENLPPEINEKVDRLVRNSDKLGELITLISQSYDYDSFEPNAEPSADSPVNLSAVLTNCLDLQLPFAASKSAELRWKLPDNDMWVMGDALELTRVFDNLVRNAIKHNAANTQIMVVAESRGLTHTVKVIDNGQGIAPEDLEHIFETGYRVNPSQSDGQGLGLDIVQTLVSKMGGNIVVSSEQRKGTEFTVSFPSLEAGH